MSLNFTLPLCVWRYKIGRDIGYSIHFQCIIKRHKYDGVTRIKEILNWELLKENSNPNMNFFFFFFFFFFKIKEIFF